MSDQPLESEPAEPTEPQRPPTPPPFQPNESLIGHMERGQREVPTRDRPPPRR